MPRLPTNTSTWHETSVHLRYIRLRALFYVYGIRHMGGEKGCRYSLTVFVSAVSDSRKPLGHIGPCSINGVPEHRCLQFTVTVSEILFKKWGPVHIWLVFNVQCISFPRMRFNIYYTCLIYNAYKSVQFETPMIVYKLIFIFNWSVSVYMLIFFVSMYSYCLRLRIF